MKHAVWFPVASLIGFVSLAVLTPAASARPQFKAPFYVSTLPLTPQDVVVADVNEDGKPDVITAASDASISVHLGQGNDWPAPLAGMPLPAITSSWIAAGDVNNDGHVDLAVINQTPAALSIYLGAGDGTFGPKADFPMPGAPRRVVLADMNEDGNLDAAATSGPYDEGYLCTWIGLGNGQFVVRETRMMFPVTPCGLITGDFNADGHADLAYTCLRSWRVIVSLGAGDGTFGTPVWTMAGAYPLNLAGGDLNGDGLYDCVTADTDGGSISVELGVGDGTFQTTYYSLRGVSKCNAVTLGDFNGDGHSDIALAVVPDRVTLFFNDGSGTFGAPVEMATGHLPGAVQAADLNGDGRLDLILACDKSLATHFGNGDGSFGVPTFGVDANPVSVAIGDLDQDGRPDVATANERHGTLSIRLGRPDRDFAPEVTYPLHAYPDGVTIADMNHDGFADIVAASNGFVSIFPGDGTGNVGSRADFPVATATCSPVVADLDRDGNLDVVVAHGSASFVTCLYGDGAGGLGAPVTLATPSPPMAVLAVDVTGDGLPDLITANQAAGSVSILRNLGAGTFAPPTNYPAGSGPVDLCTGDFDDDGRLDLAVARTQGLSIFNGDGSGAFTRLADVTGFSYPQALAVIDANHDGHVDVVVAVSHTARVCYGNADGTFTDSESYGSGHNPTDVAVGDLDLDGEPDVALSNYGGDIDEDYWAPSFTVLWNNGQQPTPVALLSFSATRVAEGVRVSWEVPETGQRHMYRLFRSAPGGKRDPVEPAVFTGLCRYETLDRSAPDGYVDYWLRETAPDGSGIWLGPVRVTGATAALQALSLWPNPARGPVTLSFGLPDAATVRITAFDTAGRLVARLFDGTVSSGAHALVWDTRAEDGDPLSGGVYFLLLESPSGRRMERVLVLR